MRRIKFGFTLTEVILVIMLLGIMIAFAIPRYFKMIEVSRSKEAVENLQMLRDSMERCFMENGAIASGDCANTCQVFCNFDTIDAEDPSSDPYSHFRYFICPRHYTHYEIWAIRNGKDGGSNSGDDRVSLIHDGAAHVGITGYGIYSQIKIGFRIDDYYGQEENVCGPR